MAEQRNSEIVANGIMGITLSLFVTGIIIYGLFWVAGKGWTTASK